RSGIGPTALGLVGQPGTDLVAAFHDETTARAALETVNQLLSGLGVIVLVFFVGLQTHPMELLRVGPRATAIAITGVVVSFGLGLALAMLLGLRPVPALFVGAILGSTSVGITARVFADLGEINSHEARVILGAAVIDDILGLLVLAIVSEIALTGSVDPAALGSLSLQAVIFVLVA